MAKNISNFEPHPMLRNGHLQTIIATISNNPNNLGTTKTFWIDLDDGDQVYFDVDEPSIIVPTKPIIALFHGLGGCADSGYNLRISQKLTQLGYRVARFSHRGCGPTERMRAKKIYHCGSYADIYFALKGLAAKWPDQAILAVGFSISGTILLNMLGEFPQLSQEIPQLKHALTICPPLNLKRSSYKISNLSNSIYSRYFTHYLKQQVSRRETLYPDVPRTNFSKSLNLKKFDEEFTAPAAGFFSSDDYYEQCSPIQRIANIQTPTIIIAAADDPVVCNDAYNQLKPSHSVNILMQNSGGHMGFVSKNKTSFGDYRWMDEAIVNWTNSRII